jgi:cell division protein FtsI (penicillin-binding protein 3)
MEVHVTHNRIALLAMLLLLGLAGALLRLVQFQVIQRSSLQARARAQQLHQTTLPARRGSILDRHGMVLAESVVTESVFVNAKLARGSRDLVRRLASALGVNAQATERKIRRGKSFWVKRNARLEQTALLKALHSSCLTFVPESKRIYPQARLACHLLGFTNVDNRGLEGVEKEYDEELAGRPGLVQVARDAHGKVLPADDVVERQAENGSDVVLTLDGQYQQMAERELHKACAKFRPNWGAVVAMDPSNGEVLALANWPDYDPNEAAHFPLSTRRDRAVVDAFEPGSTFKVVTATLALEKGLVKPETLVDCHGGRAEFLGRVVRDHEAGLGVVPFSEVIAQSSNVGTVDVALRVGKEALYKGIQRFGYGRKTGVDLPGEAKGLLRPLADWSGVSMAAVPYGQEVSGNLFHLACAYAAVANGGYSVAPHVVKEIRSPSGWDHRPRLEGEAGRRVLGSYARTKLVGMLKEVVDHGTGTPAALPGFLVAGKTGTAEKVDPATRRYSFSKTVSSFVGFVPADKPKLLMAIVLDEPHGLSLGGWVAGPVFRESALSMLAAQGLSPDSALLAGRGAQQGIAHLPGEAPKWHQVFHPVAGAIEAAWVPVPALEGMDGRQALRVLKAAKLKAVPKGRLGLVVSQFPQAGRRVRLLSSVSYLLASQDGRTSAQSSRN